MQEVTFIIPVRIDSYYRLRNLQSVVGYILAGMENAKFLIVEADSTSKLTGLLENERVRKFFIKDEKPIFHRTRYVNDMFKIADTPIAAVWDADAIGEIANIRKAVALIEETGTVMVYPYNGIFWSVGQWHSEIFCDKMDLDVLTKYPQSRSLMCGYHSVGGAFLVDVERYRKKGWENEFFIGWGPEDSERYSRLEILGNKPLRIDAELYHLYHPRGINSGSLEPMLAFSTKKEYAKVCSMTTEELKDYISQWEWIK